MGTTPLTIEEEKKFKDFVNKEGYPEFKRRLENLISSYTTDLLNSKDVTFIARIEAVQAVINLCDNERS